jgi:hypothetical protein
MRPLSHWRRYFLGIAAACLSSTAFAAGANDSAPPIATEYAFMAQIALGAPVVVGQGPEGLRRFIPIAGGQVSGPTLTARVLPGAGDWQVVRADEVISIEARYVLETADGVRIAVTNRGLRHGPAAVMARLARGETVAPGEYYFRSVAEFQAPLGSKYEWLNKALFLTTGERRAETVIVYFYRLL